VIKPDTLNVKDLGGYMDLKIFFQQLYKNCVRVDCFTSAGTLAFFSLLSILPIALLTFSVLSLTPWGDSVALASKNWIFNHLMVASAQKMEVYLHEITMQANVSTWKSYLLLMITAVFMMFCIELALNRIWRVAHGRNSILGFLAYAAGFLIFPLIIVFLFVIQSYVGHFYVHFPEALSILLQYVWVSSLCLCALLFSLLYYLVPCCKVSYKYALFGGGVAAFCFLISKKLFSLYFYNYSSYPIVFGALSAIPAFLLWLYFSWVIILFGAVVSYVAANEQ
jgi:membrane protein